MSENQERVSAEADAVVKNLIESVQPDADEPITSADIFDVTRPTARRYMLGGGGPTSYAVVIRDGGEYLVLIEVIGWSERAHRVLYGRDAQAIATALANSERERP